MSCLIKLYQSQIKELEQKIKELDLTKNLTLNKLTERNFYLCEIAILKTKINNKNKGLPVNGYAEILSNIRHIDN